MGQRRTISKTCLTYGPKGTSMLCKLSLASGCNTRGTALFSFVSYTCNLSAQAHWAKIAPVCALCVSFSLQICYLPQNAHPTIWQLTWQLLDGACGLPLQPKPASNFGDMSKSSLTLHPLNSPREQRASVPSQSFSSQPLLLQEFLPQLNRYQVDSICFRSCKRCFFGVELKSCHFSSLR